MAYRNDILKPGTKENPTWYYAPPGHDFMKTWGLNPGDVVGIRVGPNGENYMNNVDLGEAYANGITFVNDPDNPFPIEIGWFGMGRDCLNVKLLGNGSKAVPYGFKLTQSTQLGASCSCIGDIEIAYIQCIGTAMGVMLSTRPGVQYKLDYQRAHLHHLDIAQTSDEAMYLGYVQLSPIQMELWVHDVNIKDAGRDGIQTRNTKKVLIENCNLDGVGVSTRPDYVYGHDHGILFSNCPDGAIVRNVKAKRIHGVGIWNDGFGSYLYENNEIQSEHHSTMFRTFNPDPNAINWGDEGNIGYSKHTLINNILTPTTGVTAEMYTKPEIGKIIEFTATGNRCPNVFNIPNDVKKNITNNGPDVVPTPAPTPDPVPTPTPEPTPAATFTGRKGYWLLDGHRVYYKVYKADGKYFIKTGDYTWYKLPG